MITRTRWVVEIASTRRRSAQGVSANRLIQFPQITSWNWTCCPHSASLDVEMGRIADAFRPRVIEGRSEEHRHRPSD